MPYKKEDRVEYYANEEKTVTKTGVIKSIAAEGKYSIKPDGEQKTT
ncbi:7604_t:CDS:2, partial [Scutellospora calospora]